MRYKVFESFNAADFEMKLNAFAEQGYILFKAEFLVADKNANTSSYHAGQSATNTTTCVRYVACLAKKQDQV